MAWSNFTELSKKVFCSEQSYLQGLLAFQELSVRSNLLLQSSLDIHEDLVLAVLALHVTSELSQLRLEAADEALHLRQLRAVPPFRVCQRAFQRRSLRAQGLEGSHGKVPARCRTAWGGG